MLCVTCLGACVLRCVFHNHKCYIMSQCIVNVGNEMSTNVSNGIIYVLFYRCVICFAIEREIFFGL